MTKQAIKKMVIPKKKRGRPFTGVDNRDPVMSLRMPLDVRSKVESWAKAQDEKLTLSKAIVRLVEQALAAKPAKAPAPRKPKK
jgi:hypothetical protein